MQFRILGPLEVVHQGSRVRIEGAKQCMALAVLLLEAGHAVPLHRFVDALWDGRPPNTARRQVQNTLAGLRRSLAEYGPDPIERIRESYRINAVELDWADFKRDTARARERIESRAFGDAADLLVESLGRWRGPALADLNGDRIQAFALHLNETRSVAVESLIDVELEIGRFTSAVDRARELLASHPHRQQTVRRLMRGLHDGGHTAEALAVFDGFRTRLAEDLGLDPDGALHDLHQRILRAEVPSPVHPPQPPARPALKRRDEADSAPPVPAQLPADTSVFVGRETQLAQLDSLLEPGAPSMAAVTGAGGCGKTALAVHWGYRRRDRFPDGQLYLNLRGYDTGAPLEPIDAIRSILRALDCPGPQIPDSLPDAAALYRSLVCERKLLVVLDNARSAAQVRPLIPGGSGTVTIVTSRDRLSGLVALHDAEPVSVGAMTSREAADLLAAIVEDARSVTEPEAMHRIAELCGRHPMAMRVASANLALRVHESAAAFADQLADEAHRMALLSVEGDPDAAMTAVFDKSVAMLSDEARTVLCLLGAIPGSDFAAELIEAIGPVDPQATRNAVSALVNGHLLEPYRPGRFRFHDLIRLYAAQRQTMELSGPQRTEVIDRFIGWHYRERRPDELDNILDAWRRLAGHRRSWRLIAALHSQVNGGHSLNELRNLGGCALSTADAQGDVEGVVQLHGFLASLENITGDSKGAEHHLVTALELMKTHGLGDDDGSIRSIYGNLRHHEGHVHEAAQYTHEAVLAAERSGNERIIGIRLANLGRIYRKTGRFAESEALLLRAMRMKTQPEIHASHYSSLALTYLDLGRLREADLAVERALSMVEEQMWPRTVTQIQKGAARVRLRQGRLAEAEDLLVSAADHCRRHRYREAGYEARYLLALVRHASGDLKRAQDEIEQVLAEVECGRGSMYVADTRLAAAEILLDRDVAAAQVHGEHARIDFASFGIPLQHGRSLLVLARAAAALGESERARVLSGQAREVFSAIGVPDSEGAERLSIDLACGAMVSVRQQPR